MTQTPDPETSRSDDIRTSVAVGLPLLAYFGYYVLGSFGTDFYKTYVDGEYGLVEIATLITLAAAIYYALRARGIARRRDQRLLSAWLAVFAVGAFYFLGEEASWGQHIFGWETPEEWANRNDQAETNLHNSSGLLGALLDQIPRAILTFSAFFLGFVYPLWRKVRSVDLPRDGQLYWFMPTSACMTVGVIAAFASVPGKIVEAVTETPPAVFGIDFGEIKELMIAIFLMFYALSLYKRLRAAEGGATPAA